MAKSRSAESSEREPSGDTLPNSVSHGESGAREATGVEPGCTVNGDPVGVTVTQPNSTTAGSMTVTRRTALLGFTEAGVYRALTASRGRARPRRGQGGAACPD